MDRIDTKRTRLVSVLAIAAGLVVFTVMLFQVPLATVFSLGLFLVCPLLMVGMHRAGHGAEHVPHADEHDHLVGKERGGSP